MAAATPAEIKKWKSIHNRIHEIEVEVGGEKTLNYFRHPDLETIVAATKYEGDGVKPGMILFESCKIKVDPRVENDDEAKMGVIAVLANLFQIKVATIKEL